MNTSLVLGCAAAYLLLLFAVARWGDYRSDRGRSIIAHPLVYALSIGVYCTAWTFYGSVGRAARDGFDFLAIYLGPTLAWALWWVVIRRMLRISKTNRITSIADFIGSRYGKSQLVGGLVTVVTVVSIVPYIALQLKAIATSYGVLAGSAGDGAAAGWDVRNAGLLVAIVMGIFAMLFGTRHIDATERHEGMVAAIALESLVKLCAFLVLGIYVTFGLFGGFAGLFGRAAAELEASRLFTAIGQGGYVDWSALVLLSMLAALLLPRQFQVTVVENVDERHLRRAAWLFPLYLLLINVFVLPIALAGLVLQPGADADAFVLSLPLATGRHDVALLVFLGGLSAGTGMLIVETVALSTMLCNDLVMPLLLRFHLLQLSARQDLTAWLRAIRRGSIVLVLLLGYLYMELVGSAYALVAMGLISFAGVAQFAPALLGGMFWRRATRTGAIAGIVLGFAVWSYTLFLPAFARSGIIAADFIAEGPFGLALLKPYALLGLGGLEPLTHGLLWSLFCNLGGLVLGSLLSGQSQTERVQATRFVDVFLQGAGAGERRWLGDATSMAELKELLVRFVGVRHTDEALRAYASTRGIAADGLARVDAGFAEFAERLLAGAIGAASARIAVASVVRGAGVSLPEVMQILDESSSVFEYSRELEDKSRLLERATAELRAANEHLRELDRLKDEFLSTVTHELRTPLTSIRAFCEILHDSPDLPVEKRQQFLAIIISDAERLTRLINQVLDLAKLEAGRFDWNIGAVDVNAAVRHAAATMGQLFADRGITVSLALDEVLAPAEADRDALIQVLVNLLSNAAKFCPPGDGRINVTTAEKGGSIEVRVQDNGPGIAPADQARIFQKFAQIRDPVRGKPAGSGLGLTISLRIIERFGGSIWVESTPGEGATFAFTLPLTAPQPAEREVTRSAA